MFKIFDLKEYTQWFTIPEPASNLQYQIQSALNYNPRTNVSNFKFGSLGNTDMVIHQTV